MNASTGPALVPSSVTGSCVADGVLRGIEPPRVNRHVRLDKEVIHVWEPLSTRIGRPDPDGPHEGAPEHLRRPLYHWLTETLFDSDDATSSMYAVMAACRIPSVTSDNEWAAAEISISNYCHASSEQFLDVLHAVLQIEVTVEDVDRLERLLAYGGSAWTATLKGLQRRVDMTAQVAFDLAAQPADVASGELKEAWSKAYGRAPDPSDAWDHAIKAVEAILIPVVVPNQAKPTLGHVVSHLATQGRLWKLLLPGADDRYSVEPLVGMLRLLWPNPDRHGSPEHRRAPTLEEAQAVVHLAVTILQWGRKGHIVKT